MARTNIADAMASAGFTLCETGGGCTAWIAELCAEYDAFLEKTGLPKWSADELWHELAHRIEQAETETETLRAQQEWVWRFWMRWEAMEDAERMAGAN